MICYEAKYVILVELELMVAGRQKHNCFICIHTKSIWDENCNRRKQLVLHIRQKQKQKHC